MTNKTITVPYNENKITLPSGADEWQLYSSMPGAEAAANRLTAALARALVAPGRAKAIRIMSKALKLDAKFGAYDTEPVYVAESILAKGRNDDFSWAL